MKYERRHRSGKAYVRKSRQTLPVRWLLAALLVVTMAAGMYVWRKVQPTLAASEALPPRLHVVAHSDGAQDQALKLAVRDALRPVVRAMLDMDMPRLEERWSSFVPRLQAKAEAELVRQGAGYGASVRLVRDGSQGVAAVRVVLGEGRGANWFCVLAPPLCFADLEPIEKEVQPTNYEEEVEAGGVRIAWRWLGRWFGPSIVVPGEYVGQMHQDDVHTDLSDALPRDGHIGFTGK